MTKEKRHLTLSLICDGSRVLLGMKKRGFGAGKWNGFGGKCEQGETVIEAAQREVREESGIVPTVLVEKGVITFSFKGDPMVHEVAVFMCEKYKGEPFETEEMRPAWFRVDDLPFEEMWAGDRLWLPRVLNGDCVEGSLLFDSEGEVIQEDLVFTPTSFR